MLTAVLAATLDVAEKINQFGAYAGLAAIVGLAVLSLLYFSQAREIKRLREWAGRSPERAAELEAAATQAAQQRLAPHPQARATAAAASVAAQQSTTVSPARPVGAPAAVPQPGQPVRQQVPPGQAVTAAGTPSPAGVPRPATPASTPATPAAGAAAAAAAAAAASRGAPPAPPGTASPQQATTATPAVGQPPAPQRPVPAPAVPAAAPAAAAPQTARAQSAAPLRAPSAAAYQPGSSRSRNNDAQRELGVEGRSPLRSTLMIVGGVVAVAIVVFVLVTQIFGSDDAASPVNTVATPDATTPKTETTAKKAKKKSSAPTVARGSTTVAVLNGTGTTGLAASESTKLADKGFKAGGTGDAPVKPVQATTIYYAPEQRAAADEVAGVLGLPATSVKAMDATISAVDVVSGANVVVVVGADQATATG